MRYGECIKTIFDAEEINQISSIVRTNRSSLKQRDISLLKYNGITMTIDEMTSIPKGYFQVKGKVTMDMFFHPGIDKKKIVIFLNGSRTSDIPEFKRWSYYSQLDCSILNIADPMYRMFNNLSLGWYYGTTDFDLRAYIASVVEKIIAILNNPEVTICASSGGGSAAIHLAHIIGKSNIIVINPQLKLNLYKYSKTFSSITGNDLQSDDVRNDVTKLIGEKEVKTLLITNISSEDDVPQLSHLAKERGIKIKYGINSFDNLIIWTYDAPGKIPHNSQEFFPLFGLFLKTVQGELHNMNEGELSWYINEFWYDHFSLDEKYNISRKNSEKNVIAISSNNNECITHNVVLEPSNNPWNHITLLSKPSPRTLYHLKLNDIKYSDNNIGVVIILKNINKDKILFREFVEISGFECFIYVDENVDGNEIRLYPGSIGNPLKQSVTINCTIRSLNCQQYLQHHID